MRFSSSSCCSRAPRSSPGCGDDAEGYGHSDAPSSPSPWVDPDGDPPYIGSLSVNPADGSIFMGTNTGLFADPAQTGGKPAKVTGQLKTPDGAGAVSESLVASSPGPDALIASGHPSAGLVAAAGPRADPLRRRGQDVGVGVRAGHVGLPRAVALGRRARRAAVRAGADPALARRRQDASSRAWRRWRSSTSPPTRATPSAGRPRPSTGIFVSTDEGRTWRQRDPTPNVRLAWHEPDELYRIDPGGPVKVSATAARPGRTAAAPAASRRRWPPTPRASLYAATLDGKRPAAPRTAARPGRRSSLPLKGLSPQVSERRRSVPASAPAAQAAPAAANAAPAPCASASAPDSAAPRASPAAMPVDSHV